MKRLLLLISATALITAIALGGNPIVRVFPQDRTAWKRLGSMALDDVGQGRNYLDIVATPKQRAALTALGCFTEVIAPDIEQLERQIAGRKGYYHTLAGMRAVLDSIVTAHPAIAKVDSIGYTWEGRPILCLTITQNVSDTSQAKPQVLYMGQHHAREYIGMEVVLYLAKYLAGNYGSDTVITNLVNHRILYLIPCVNPDGHYHCFEQGFDCRKNARDNNLNGVWDKEWDGVDLNRNYDGAQNGDTSGNWGGNGSSHNPKDAIYCGPSAFSEPETRAIRDFCLSHRLAMSMSYHSYSECLMWSWGYTHDLAPDGDILSQLGTGMAELITRESGSGTYDPYQSAGMYFTTGDSEDWIYGYSKYHTSHITLSYITEVGSEFAPPDSVIDQICIQNTKACILMAQGAAAPFALFIPGPPALAASSTTPAGGNFTLNWAPANANAGIDRYELHQLTGLIRITDSAEAAFSNWGAASFAVSDSRYHSPIHSFRADSVCNMNALLQSAAPFTVRPGDSLAYWRWVSTEAGWDYFYIDVSADGGSTWTNLETLTGLYETWTRRAISLSPFAGRQLTVRFRYATDFINLGGGVYLDDISPVGHFNTDSLMADTITVNSFDIKGLDEGTYYYTVRAHNTMGWGRSSNAVKVTVTNGAADTTALSTCTLNQACPNPFSGTTRIQFALPEAAKTTLTVYNIAGQKVRTLASGIKPAGCYIEMWDGRNSRGELVAAGVYLYRLDAGSFSAVNKLVVVR